MESITVYPSNEKQHILLKSLLEELKIRFEVDKKDDYTLFSEEEFYSKIDRSIEQAKAGYVKSISREELKERLGL